MSPRSRNAIVGIGQTRSGRVPGVSMMGFYLEAAKLAIEDSGLEKNEIDGVLCWYPAGLGELHGYSTRVAALLGIAPSLCFSLDMGGATSVGMVQLAAMAIDCGLCRSVLCIIGSNGASRTTNRADAMRGFVLEFSGPLGDYGAAAFHAQQARRYMHAYGATSETMGAVAIAARKHGALNPRAQHQRTITMEDYLASRWIVEPLRLYDCCLITDGGVAVVVTSKERAKDLPHRPIFLAGWGQEHAGETMKPGKHGPDFGYGKSAGRRAFAMSGLRPGDMDLAQIYDCFTITVLLELEAYGFCGEGEAKDFVKGGRLELGGGLPFNTSGGLLSEGHLMGMNHVAEAVSQLRGDAGPRQVNDARSCFVCGYGGAPHESPPVLSYATLVLVNE